jgi:branched-chain amino acid transport system permease protein
MKTSTSLGLPTRGAPNQSAQPRTVITMLKVMGVLALLAFAVLFPPFFSPDDATTTVAVSALMFAAWATAWNIFSGYSGYIALGHAAFFGSGAYALAIMCQRWGVGLHDVSLLGLTVPADYAPFLLVPVAGLIAALISIPVGWIALHTRRHTFIVVTIAIFFIFQLLAENNIGSLTGGTAGLEFHNPSWIYPFFNDPFYYAMLIILVLAVVVSWWVRHSKYGLGLLAIRDDEDRALGLGVKTGPSKLVAFVIAAFFAGMLGGVWAYFIGSVFPQSAYDPLNDITLALMAFMGGLGTISGPIIGALIIEWARQNFDSFLTQFLQSATFLPEKLRDEQNTSGYYLIIYGALFLIVVLALPEGIVPTARKWLERWRSRQTPASGAAGTPGQPETLAVGQAASGGEGGKG